MTEIIRKLTKQDIRNTLAVTWTVLSFLFIFRLVNHTIPLENKDTINTVAGVVVGQLVVIISFYFTQSKSEVDKTKRDAEDH